MKYNVILKMSPLKIRNYTNYTNKNSDDVVINQSKDWIIHNPIIPKTKLICLIYAISKMFFFGCGGIMLPLKEWKIGNNDTLQKCFFCSSDVTLETEGE